MAAKKKKAKKSAEPKAKAIRVAPAPAVAPVQTIPQVDTSGAPILEGARDPARVRILREFQGEMNKESKRVVMANEAPNTYELRRPTGIMQLDLDIGGGFPAGGLSVISGPDNAGKTFLLLKAMAMHQRIYGAQSALAFATAEGAFDFKRALAAGMLIEIPDEILSQWNTERRVLGLPDYTADEIRYFKRQIGEFVIFRAYTGEQLMDTVLEGVRKNFFGIIGVDSFSVLLPEADEDKSVGETPKRGGNANLMTDFIKKYTPLTSGIEGTNYTSLIGIMQVRANADKANASAHIQKYLKDWAVTGAYATRHGKLVDLTIWDGEVLKKESAQGRYAYGKMLHWKTEKGKAGCHDNVFGEVEYRYDLPQGTDDISTIIMVGIRRGVFVEERGKIEIYHPVTREKTDLGGFNNYAAFGRVMYEDFEFSLKMRSFVAAASGIQCLYRL